MRILIIGDFHGKVSKKLKREISKQEFDFVIGVGDYAGIKEWYSYIKYVFNLNQPDTDNENIKSPQDFFGKEKFKQLLKKDFEAGKETLKFLDELGRPGFFVFGNSDEEWYNYPFSKKILQAKKRNLNFLKKLRNLKEMTYKVKNQKGTLFLGFGGYMDAIANDSSRDKEWQKRVDIRTEKASRKMELLLKKIRKKSIFILHYPPLGVFDKILDKKNPFYGGSTGVNFFREAILKKKPFLVLCGHMHEYQGKKRLGDSIIVNPGEAAKGKFAIIDLDEKKGKIRDIKFYKGSK